MAGDCGRKKSGMGAYERQGSKELKITIEMKYTQWRLSCSSDDLRLMFN